MTLLDIYSKQQYKISKSRYLVVRIIELRTLYLRIQALTIWILLQRLGVANRTALLDLM